MTMWNFSESSPAKMLSPPRMKFSGPSARVPLPSVCSSVLNSVSPVQPTKAESGMVSRNGMPVLLDWLLMSWNLTFFRFVLPRKALRAKVIVRFDVFTLLSLSKPA